MNRRTPGRPRTIFLLVAMLLLCSLGTGTALAQDTSVDQPRFEIAAAGIDGSFFDLTVEAGSSTTVEFNVVNKGPAAGAAQVYLADVGTRVNGGMAVALQGERLNAPGTWTDFTSDVLNIEPASSSTREVIITVPPGTPSGEYLTSIVVQSADAAESQEQTGGVQMTTVSRQALALLVTVPGEMSPSLAINTAEHRAVGGASVVAFHLNNPGNVRLKTSGEAVVVDSNDTEVFRTPVSYQSIYAGTPATFEAPLGLALEPGDYTAFLQLRAEGYDLEVASGALPFTVTGKIAAPVNQLPENESATQPAVIETQMAGLPVWVIVALIPLAIIAGAVGVYLAMKRRMQPQVAQVQPGAITMHRPPVVAVRRVPVKQIVPPSREEVNG